MEALLSAGLGRLHLRKPGADAEALEGLVRRLAPQWASRLVLHGPNGRELALRYGVPNVHGAVLYKDGRGYSGGGPMVDAAGLTPSTSVHSWEEFRRLPAGLTYAFISPLFDSISKPGYRAGTGLIKQPNGELPCVPVGLGGVSDETIGPMLECGWRGAAVLGWIWEERGRELGRLEQLQKVIAHAK